MTPEQEKGRERMKTEPFAPIPIGSVEERHSHAMTYAAFYLGEIEKHLRKIADALDVNAEKTRLELQAIVRALESKT